jgi:DNA-binding NarL/FixJ family response regulator
MLRVAALPRDQGQHPSRDGAHKAKQGPPRNHSRAAKSKVDVVVVSDDPFTRRAFSSGARAPDIAVIAKATLAEAVEVIGGEVEPDIVLLDVQVAAGRALLTIQQLHEQAPAARILACDTPTGTEFGLLCLIAGALGYVSKEIDLVALPRLVRSLAAGEAVISRALATELAERFVSVSSRAGTMPSRRLSGPESQVLELLRGRLTLPEVAAELNLSLATVQRHLGSARRKLSAQRTAPGGETAAAAQTRHTKDPQEGQ